MKLTTSEAVTLLEVAIILLIGLAIAHAAGWPW